MSFRAAVLLLCSLTIASALSKSPTSGMEYLSYLRPSVFSLRMVWTIFHRHQSFLLYICVLGELYACTLALYLWIMKTNTTLSSFEMGDLLDVSINKLLGSVLSVYSVWDCTGFTAVEAVEAEEVCWAWVACIGSQFSNVRSTLPCLIFMLHLCHLHICKSLYSCANTASLNVTREILLQVRSRNACLSTSCLYSILQCSQFGNYCHCIMFWNLVHKDKVSGMLKSMRTRVLCDSLWSAFVSVMHPLSGFINLVRL